MSQNPLSIVLTSLALTLAVRSSVAAELGAEPRALKLDEALALVDTQNPELGEQRARVERAEAVARQALSALLPIVKATGNYTLNNQEAGVVSPAGALVIQPKDAFTASASLQVPLFAGHAYWDIARARELGRAESARLDAQRQRLRGAVVRTAWLVQSARSVVQVAERGVTSANEHLESARRAEAAGTSTPLAVLQAKSDLARRTGELTEARAGVERAELALGTLLGRAEPVQVALPPLAEEGSSADLTALIDASLAARPEVAMRSHEQRASEHGVTSSSFRFLPVLSGSFAAFASDEPYVTGEQQGWRAGLELSWTLYDGEYRYGKRQEAQAEHAQAQAADKGTRLAIAREVQDAAIAVRVARDRVAAGTDESQAADEAAAAAQRSFAAGQASSLEVIDALDRQTQAAVGLERARAELGVALADLRTARGIAW